MLNTIINERYRIDAEIGQGGMGIVYRAFDLVLERDVAVKELSNYKLGNEGKARLLAEAKTVAQLNHPNIVSVFDAGEHDGTPFIVMEFVEGKTLRENAPTSWDDILAVTRQICSSLEHAHSHEVIHRDLKPENVIIGPDGNTKLMDFGLAHSVSSRFTSEGKIFGTVFYMSPEQAMGRSVDARSDLYSLGIMLYEFATGDVPFSDQDAIAVISQHINAPIVPPRAKRSDIPPGIEALILALLEKDPDDRPDSATAVLKTINDPMFLDTGAIPARDLTLLDRIVRGRMVGRKSELDQARKLWNESSEGKGQSLLISGEPGIGKTRLVKEIVTLAEVAGGQAFIGESYAEGGVPYDAFTQIVRQVLNQKEGNKLELPDFVLADLIELSPELKPYYPDIQPNPSLDPEAHQRRLFENMVTFCEKLSENKPLLIVVDDAHWSDSGTLHMLRHLMRRTRELPVMLIATYREVELDEAKPFHEVMLDLNRERLGSRIKLSRLEREQTKKLLNVIFDDDVAPEFLEGIHKETEGNPFFIEEVCKALVESGKLYYEDGEWHRPDNMDDLEIPQGVKVAIQYRVNKLPESSKDAMVAAAVIGREFDFSTLLKVTESDEDALIDAIEHAVRAQLIDELRNKGGEIFSFSHALIPAALRETLGGLRRIRMHRRVAAAIHELHPEEFELLAYHYSEAGNDEQSFAFTIKAAERATDSYANQDAILFYTNALAVVGKNDPKTFELLSKRAAVYNTLALRDPQGQDLLKMLSLAESLKDNTLMAESLIALSSYSFATDKFDQQKIYSEKAYKLAQDLEDPLLVAECYLEYGSIFMFSGQLSQLQKILTTAKDVLQKVAVTILSARVHNNLGSVLLSLREPDAALEEALKALEISQNLKNLQWEANSLITISGVHYQQADYVKAIEYLQQVQIINRQTGKRQAEFYANMGIAWNQRCLGNYDKLMEYINKSLEIVSEIGEPSALINVLSRLSTYRYFYKGDLEEGLNFLTVQLQAAEDTGDTYVINAVRLSQAEFQTYIGDYETAYNTFEILRIEAPEWQGWDDGFTLMSGYCQMQLDNFEQSRDLMEKVFETKLQSTERRSEIGDMQTYLARLDYLEGDIDKYPQALEKTLLAIESYGGLSGGIMHSGWTNCAALNLAARLQLALGKNKEALEHSTQLVKIVENEIIALTAPHYFSHSLALRANNKTEEADTYLQRAYDRVTSVGNKIKDLKIKTAWLETNRQNQEILEAYKTSDLSETSHK